MKASIITLMELLNEGERIAEYSVVGSYSSYNCIIAEDSDDIASALECTLHRLIENGYEDSIYFIMGAYVPTDEELSELDKYGEYINIDLGYVLPSMLSFE